MKKKQADLNSPIGENTSLTISIPRELQEKAYAKVLGKIAALVTVPGFRKGKAPMKLVEEQVGRAKIVDQVLEDVIPDLYAEAVKKAGIAPLVHPHLSVKELPEDGDWVIEAETAVAPTVELGDWKKVIAKSGKEYTKDEKKSEEEQKQEKLSFVLGKLLENVNPKIAPLLIEHEARRQIEEFARHLAEHRIELDQYLASTKKTVQSLQEEYTAASLASLQLEFVLNAITAELDPKPSDEEIAKLLGDGIKKLSKEEQKRLEDYARQTLSRQATIEEIRSIAT